MQSSPVRFLLGLALGATLLHARKHEDFPGLEGKWRYYQSPHFELYSLNSDWDSRDALERLELIRAVFLETFKLKERQPMPVTIYYFDSSDDFAAYLPDAFGKKVKYVGLCSPQADRAVITLSPTEYAGEARSEVYHEFIHYLFKIADEDPPLWFNEGVAELYSTIKDEHDSVSVGLPAEGRVYDLQLSKMLPLEQLFGMTHSSDVFKSDNHTGVFYAESWAFLHFCTFGTSHFPPDKLRQFVKLASSERATAHPVELRQACRDLLGCDYPQLMDQLQHYVTSGSYHWRRFPRPKIDAPTTYTRRDVARGEMSERLAELALRINRTPLAKLVLLKAIDAKPDDYRPLEALGNDAMTDGDLPGARERWEKAVELGSVNPAVYQKLADMESRRWFEQFDLYFRLPDVRTAQLRALLLRSIKLAPEQSQAYEMLAWVESAARNFDPANVNLVQQQFSKVKDKVHTVLALALIRVRSNDLKEARALLAVTEKMEPEPSERRIAEIIREELDRRESLAGVASPEGATPANQSTTPGSG